MVCILILGACDAKEIIKGEIPEDKIIAKVNEQVILKEDYESLFKYEIENYKSQFEEKEVPLIHLEDFSFDRLVRLSLMEKEAKKFNIHINKRAIRLKIDELKEFSPTADNTVLEVFAKENLLQEELIKTIQVQTSFTEEEKQAFYNGNIDRFNMLRVTYKNGVEGEPEEVLVSYQEANKEGMIDHYMIQELKMQKGYEIFNELYNSANIIDFRE